MSKNITHEGVVTHVGEDIVSVLIVQHSACSGCHARGACTVSDQKEKIIEAVTGGVDYAVGDRVMLIGSNGMAWSALAYAFIVPLALCMAVLFIVAAAWGEGAGAVAVGALLVAYYIGLFLMRDRLKTKFTFTVRRME